MIDIPPALQARLKSGVTMLAWAWVLRRRDGLTFGFTDHDAPLDADGVRCEPSSGFAAGELRSETGDAPARGAVFGAINSDRITDADLDNGLWDGASVTVWRVDWTDPTLRYKAFTGELGAVTRGPNGFEAELAGLSARLNRMIGRVFSRRCDAELGDARCGVDLEAPGRRVSSEVLAVMTAATVEISPPPGADPERFVDGVLVWGSGVNAGARSRVTTCQPTAAGWRVVLDPAPASAPRTGDGLTLTLGCDKRFETCRTRFGNGLNFRGCPHMPGNDALLRPVSKQAGRAPVRRDLS